jgi:hypothetical protein
MIRGLSVRNQHQFSQCGDFDLSLASPQYSSKSSVDARDLALRPIGAISVVPEIHGLR